MKTKHLQEAMCGWRHDFHLHPELGFKEHRTAENVADLLEEFGIQIHRGIGGTGIVGILQSGDGTHSGSSLPMRIVFPVSGRK